MLTGRIWSSPLSLSSSNIKDCSQSCLQLGTPELMFPLPGHSVGPTPLAAFSIYPMLGWQHGASAHKALPSACQLPPKASLVLQSIASESAPSCPSCFLVFQPPLQAVYSFAVWCASAYSLSPVETLRSLLLLLQELQKALPYSRSTSSVSCTVCAIS